MYEIFEKLLKKKGVKASDVSKATGVVASTFSDWKKGKSSPKIEKMVDIAHYFNVSLDYLATGKEYRFPNPDLSDEFVELIDLFNSCDEEGQNRIMEYARMVAKEYKR